MAAVGDSDESGCGVPAAYRPAWLMGCSSALVQAAGRWHRMAPSQVTVPTAGLAPRERAETSRTVARAAALTPFVPGWILVWGADARRVSQPRFAPMCLLGPRPQLPVSRV